MGKGKAKFKRSIAMVLSGLMLLGNVNASALAVHAEEVEAYESLDGEMGLSAVSDYILENGEAKDIDGEAYSVIKTGAKSYIASRDKEGVRELLLMADADSFEFDGLMTVDNRLFVKLAEGQEACELEYSFYIDDKKVKLDMPISKASLSEDVILSLETTEDVSDELISKVNAVGKAILADTMPEWDTFLKDEGFSGLKEVGLTGWDFGDVEETSDEVEETATAVTEEESTDLSTETAFETEETVTEETETETTEEITETETETTTEEETFTTEETSETLTEEETISESEDGEDLELEATYDKGVERIGLNLTKLDVYVGDSFQLKTYLFPENPALSDNSITFVSSKPEIATVDANGKVEGVAAGDAVITVTCGSAEATCSVHVIDDEVLPEDKMIGIAEGIWMAGFEDSLEYTGAKVTQNIRVYDHKKLLKEKTDYTVTYLNNINAAPSDQLKSPSMTVTLKGQYDGKKTVYFAITPRDMSETIITTDDMALTYNKKEQRYVPAVMYANKKLVNKKDFSVEYYTGPARMDIQAATGDFLKGNEWSITPVYYRLTGITGNYKGSIDGTYYIVGKEVNLSKATIKIATVLKYTGKPFTEADLKLSVVMPGKREAEDPSAYQYTIKKADGTEVLLENINEPGTYTVIITPYSGMLAGKAEKKIKVNSGNVLSKYAVVNEAAWTAEVPYNKDIADDMSGPGIIQPGYSSNNYLVAKEDVEIDGGNTLVMGVDYTVTYTNNRKAGTAKITFKGIGRFTGTITKTYKILKGNNLTATLEETKIPYLTGGAIPAITVTDEYGTVLVEKKDYTVAYKNNKQVGTDASYKITGKGNYANAKDIVNGEGTFEIVPSSLEKCSVVVADKPYSTKAGAYKSVPALYDVNGKKLTPGKDYSKDFEYIYGDCEINDVPSVGTEINVKITGTGNFEGSSVHGYYRIFDKVNNVSKLQIVVDPQLFTGRIIEPELYDEVHNTDGAIHAYASAAEKRAGNQLNAAACLRIVSYSNNIKVGTGKIVLAGKGQYGGTRTVTFKIQKKPLKTVRVEKVVIDSSGFPNMLQPGIEGKDFAYLKAYVDPGTAENKTLVWTTSNANIVQIANVETLEEDGRSVEKAKLVGTGNGRVTIKVTSQDTGKFATFVVVSQKLQIKSITIDGGDFTLNSGETKNLSYNYLPLDAYAEKLEWRSTNTNVATVDENGLVTAKHGGVAYIVLEDMDPTGGHVSGRCLVTVNEDVSQMIDASEKLETGDSTIGNLNNNKFVEIIREAAREDKSVYIPAGEYYFAAANSASNNSLRITDVSNVSVVMDKDAVIRAIPTSEANSRVVWINNARNISITGGTIIGDYGISGYSHHEDFHGIKITGGSSNICIDHVTVKNCCGDGIYFDLGTGKDIEVTNCTLSDCGRHCTSLVSSENVTIKNCIISNPRKAGGCVDIEHGPNKHVRIVDCSISVGGEAAIAVLNTASDIVVTGTTISGGGLVNRSCSSFSFNGRMVPVDPGGGVWYPY